MDKLVLVVTDRTFIEFIGYVSFYVLPEHLHFLRVHDMCARVRVVCFSSFFNLPWDTGWDQLAYRLDLPTVLTLNFRVPCLAACHTTTSTCVASTSELLGPLFSLLLIGR